MKLNYSELSRTISHALRHEPWNYGLEIDNDGWALVESLLEVLRTLKEEWKDLGVEHLEKMIVKAGKRRHEISIGKIRALYGHTIPSKFKKISTEPPEILYHGTAPNSLEAILREGLQPMTRQYVHLGLEQKYAQIVGSRKTENPTVLEINALKAFKDGVGFYEANYKVWLSDPIPAKYIRVL
jgi:putative RNA 2'-phosphotransferase